MPSLRSLFPSFPLAVLTPLPDVVIRGIACDSRKVQPGDLFVVLSGPPSDGHRYIPDAIARGAAAVVGAEPITGLAVPYVQVSDSRQALPHLAAAFYGYPARRLTLIGVTGTDGKTTTTNLIYHILRTAGIRAGIISTVNAVIGGTVLDTGFHVTTPDAPDVQRYLAQMVAAGLTHAVLEATSHGLAQYRVDACGFRTAVVTNITHEHLDFHGSYEAYRQAKARLFQMLLPGGAAVLNRDDASFEFLQSTLGSQQTVISYGFDRAADLHPLSVAHTPSGLRFDVAGKGPGRGPGLSIESPLVGDFNISNILAALAVTVGALGMSPDVARRGVANMPGVPGRMERIVVGQDFTAIVDFAHTPNALRVALETARRLTNGRIIAVFGSAGLRDRAKRRMMAETAAELADISVLTAEDPRTESLDAILAEMAAGAAARGAQEGKTFWRIPDRGEALRFAVSLAQPGDVVLACGKGHEQSMCFGEVEYPWDDRVALRAALCERLRIPGPRMPTLPTSSPR